MGSFVLSCESTADYPRSFFEARGIEYIMFHYELDGVVHEDDLYQSVTPEAFFGALKAGSTSKTSQVSVGEYTEFWKPMLEAGKDVLHLTLSSGISGTYNSAVIAARDLEAQYPDRTVRVVDSLAASAGYGLLMDYLADMRDAGATFDEAASWAEEHKLNVNHWFFVSDLDCLKRGGRVSSTSALIATALKICPVMNVDYQGKLIPREKIRTKKKAIAELVKNMMAHVENGAAYTGKCSISHSACREDAEEVARLIGSRFPRSRATSSSTISAPSSVRIRARVPLHCSSWVINASISGRAAVRRSASRAASHARAAGPLPRELDFS